jgi:hypothetical protein
VTGSARYDIILICNITSQYICIRRGGLVCVCAALFDRWRIERAAKANTSPFYIILNYVILYCDRAAKAAIKQIYWNGLNWRQHFAGVGGGVEIKALHSIGA